jgi:hypothetical protein
MAVLILLALGIITAWGTIVEARFDATTAQKLVYHSSWMYGIMGLLCVNLTAVMVDRWPWQQKHTGFILAHIGIIILIFGSVVTRYFGIDGSLSFMIGDSSRYVVVPETDITVYSSIDGSSYTRLFNREVDFLTDPPSDRNKLSIPLPDADLEIYDYMPYALREQKIVAGDPASDGPGVRFQLQNANVNMTEWLLQTGQTREAVKDLGPAQVILTRGDYQANGRNAIVLKALPDGETLEYAIYSRPKPETAPSPAPRRGTAKAGDVIETGWMGLVMRVLKYMPGAKEEMLFHKHERPTPMTTQAVKVRFNGIDRWVELNSPMKLFTANGVYILTYANRRIDLSKILDDPEFQLTLKKFEVGRYQGTMRAASYQSLVTVPGRGDVLISMNQPLDYKGFTFYQASFQEGPNGPEASILSVNRDPGRWIKYLGSLLIVLGTIHMFYFKKIAAKKMSAKAVGI